MRVIDMADIIRAMQNETQFVLRCEEVFHDKISSAAASILSAQPQKPFVCLTGPSGSGKSTVARLIASFWEADSGEAQIGGVDVRNIPLSQVMDTVAYVSQDNFLFHLSVKENIRMGKPGALRRCGFLRQSAARTGGYHTL